MRTDDLCKLLDTNEDSLIKVLEERYLLNRIYTSAGIVLISINPYTSLNLYDKNVMTAYFNSSSCDPHIYSVCENAFQDMHKQNQTIMISGESGSGKTENTKLLQDYLLVRTGTNKNLKEKIDAFTVILESFGNAKTILNDNSSRVGKMISYFIDGPIRGIKLNTFLLEKSRVTHQNKKECNFNIFYQLCYYKKLNIKNDYIDTNDKIDKNYKNIKNAMLSLKFTNIDFIENILLVILYFGFMQFVYKNNQICIKDRKVVRFICKILEINETFLENLLLKKEIKVHNEILIKYNTIEEALTIRDSISRILYVKIFDLLVEKINATLNSSEGHCINILDIFGFEVFEENSLDQLCINYANEKIQEDFVKKIFEAKQNEYELEIDNYIKIPYNFNTSLIFELEKRCGLFDLIDEESKNKFGNTKNLMNKIPKYIKKGIKIFSQDKIIVDHFIKDVTYNLKDFICKNREYKVDRLLFSKLGDKEVFDTTVLNSFLRSLNNLFKVINSTQIKYIRCIKPNNKKCNLFDRDVVYNQLISTGVLEVIKISKQIFTYEMNKNEWYEKFEKYKNVIEGKTKMYFNTNVKIGLDSSEILKGDRKRKVFDWFMEKLIDKKEGLNKIRKETEFMPSIEMCEIKENDKKEQIKFNDITRNKKIETAENIMNMIFGIKNTNERSLTCEDSGKLKQEEYVSKKSDTLDRNFSEIERENFLELDSPESVIEISDDKDLLEKESLIIEQSILNNAHSIKTKNEDIKKLFNETQDNNKNIQVENNKDIQIENSESQYDDNKDIHNDENNKDIQIENNESQYNDNKNIHNDENNKVQYDENNEIKEFNEMQNDENKDIHNDENKNLYDHKNNNIQIENENQDDKEKISIELLFSQENLSSPNLYCKPNDIMTSHCVNCANLELKYKIVSDALREANNKLSKMYPSSPSDVESASTYFSRLFYLYIENIPYFENIPRSEMLSFAHSAFLITRKTNKVMKESILIFIEEITLRLKYINKNIHHLLFFLSNLIEYSKLVEDSKDLQEIIFNIFTSLSEHYLEMIQEFIPFSITEHQELSNFKCNDSFIKKIFRPASIHKLIKTLDFINNQMDFYYLDKDYKKSILDFLLSNINTNVFNNLIIKNNFLNFNRSIQINYNINQIYTWLCKVNFLEGRNNFKHVMEVIKLVSMTSSGDIKKYTILENFELLTNEQITTFLIKMGFNYQNDDIKGNVFIIFESLEKIRNITKIEENFVIPRFISSEDLKFIFK